MKKSVTHPEGASGATAYPEEAMRKAASKVETHVLIGKAFIEKRLLEEVKRACAVRNRRAGVSR
jgi:hypothetical protein